MKLVSSRQIFKKFSNIKLYENPSNLSRVVPYRRTDITELIVCFRNIKNAPKIWILTMRWVQLSIAISWTWFIDQIWTNSKIHGLPWESDSYLANAEIPHLLYTRSFLVIFKVSRLEFLSFAKWVQFIISTIPLDFQFNMILLLRSRSSSWPIHFVFFQLKSCTMLNRT